MSGFNKFGKSFSYAARGIGRVFKEEQNFRLQAAAAALVVVLMFALGLSALEKAVLALAIASVLVLELINSIFERMADLFKPRLHPYVGDIKDIMAAAVLVASIGAAFIGLLLFWPYVIGPGRN